MIEERFHCDNCNEYRDYGIFDLSKSDRTKKDFLDKDGNCNLWQFELYLVHMTKSMLTSDEVVDLLNKLEEENKQLKHQLAQQEMEYTTDLYKQAEENDLLKKELEECQSILDKLWKKHLEKQEIW